MLAASIESACARVWCNFHHLVLQPTKGKPEENKKLRKYFGMFVYFLVLSAAAYSSKTVFDYSRLADLQNVIVDAVENEKAFDFPDVFLCPRKGVAGRVMKRPPSDAEHLENPDNYNTRTIGFLGHSQSDTMDVERLRQHEHYKYTVWYNWAIIDRLGLNRTTVDDFTDLVRLHPEFDVPLPEYFSAVLAKLRNMSETTYIDDIAYLKKIEMNRITRTQNPLYWRTPLHPWLQYALVNDRSQNNETLMLWRALTESRYVMSYTLDDHHPLHINGTIRNNNDVFKLAENLRFDITGIKRAMLHAKAIWLNDHYCVGFTDWNETAYLDRMSFYAPTFFDEVSIWVGSTQLQKIEMADFMTTATNINDSWLLNDASISLKYSPTMVAFSALSVLRRDPVCQQLIDHPANSVTMRHKFCPDVDTTAGGKYVFYQRDQVNTQWWIRNMFEIDIQINQIQIDSDPQFSDWQVVSMIGGVCGVLLGMSLMQMMQTFMSRYRMQVAVVAQLFMGSVLTIVLVLVIAEDIYGTVTSDRRVVLSPQILSPEDMQLPTLELRGTGVAMLSMNHTRLREHNVSVPLLMYLCVAASGKACSANYELYGREPKASKSTIKRTETRTRWLRHFWQHPYELLFSLIRPNDTLMAEIQQEYKELTAKLNLSISKSKAYSLLSYFFLDPCEIVLKCQMGVQQPWNCCTEFVHRAAEPENMIYALHWPNPYNLTFFPEHFHVFVDTTQFIRHSDSFYPYLGPSIDPNRIQPPHRHQWEGTHNIKLIVQPKQSSAAAGDYIDYKEIWSNVDLNKTGMGWELQFDVLARSMNKLKTITKTPCVDRRALPFRHSEVNYVRYASIAKLCGCRLHYDDPTRMLTLDMDHVPFCTTEEAIQCLGHSKFHDSFCSASSMPQRTYNVSNWDQADQYNILEPNVFLVYTFACRLQVLVSENKSVLYNYARHRSEDLKRYRDQKPCTEFQYNEDSSLYDGTIAKAQKGQHAESEGFKVSIALAPALSVGSYEDDSLYVPSLLSVALNSYGMLFGCSLLFIFDLIRSIVRKQPENRKVELARRLHFHWFRSVECFKYERKVIAPLNPMRKTVKPKGPLPDRKEPESLYTALSTAGLAVTCLVVVTSAVMYPNLTNKHHTHYRMHIDETGLEPSFALCTTNVLTDTSPGMELNKLKCLYHGANTNCTLLFPIVRILNMTNTFGQLFCAVTTQQIFDSRLGKPSKTVYQVQNLEESVFSFVWAGSIMRLKRADGNMNMNIHPLGHRNRTRIEYRLQKISRLTKCAQDGFSSNPIPSCGRSSESSSFCMKYQEQRRMEPFVNDCEQVNYVTKITTEKQGLFPRQLINETADDPGRITKVVEVYTFDMVWMEIKERWMFNWAMMIGVLGAFMNVFVGLSLVNVIYVLAWAPIELWAKFRKKKEKNSDDIVAKNIEQKNKIHGDA